MERKNFAEIFETLKKEEKCDFYDVMWAAAQPWLKQLLPDSTILSETTPLMLKTMLTPTTTTPLEQRAEQLAQYVLLSDVPKNLVHTVRVGAEEVATTTNQALTYWHLQHLPDWVRQTPVDPNMIPAVVSEYTKLCEQFGEYVGNSLSFTQIEYSMLATKAMLEVAPEYQFDMATFKAAAYAEWRAFVEPLNEAAKSIDAYERLSYKESRGRSLEESEEWIHDYANNYHLDHDERVLQQNEHQIQRLSCPGLVPSEWLVMQYSGHVENTIIMHQEEQAELESGQPISPYAEYDDFLDTDSKY